MKKNIAFETDYERFLRVRAENVQHEYLKYAHQITSGELAPNRVIQKLASTYNMTGEGIKSILKRCGVYKSAKQPVIKQKVEPTQLSMNFSCESSSPVLK